MPPIAIMAPSLGFELIQHGVSSPSLGALPDFCTSGGVHEVPGQGELA